MLGIIDTVGSCFTSLRLVQKSTIAVKLPNSGARNWIQSVASADV